MPVQTRVPNLGPGDISAGQGYSITLEGFFAFVGSDLTVNARNILGRFWLAIDANEEVAICDSWFILGEQ